MTKIDIIAIFSPLVSALLTAYFTYNFAVKSKRINILYENKIPAFKEIASKIIEFENFCIGRVAYLDGNEYSPFYEDEVGSLNHRLQISKSASVNGIFLSQNSRFLINELINNMSSLANLETIKEEDIDFNPKNEYQRMSTMANSIVDILYKELNLTEN